MSFSRSIPEVLSDTNNNNIGNIKNIIETFGISAVPIKSGKISNPKPKQSDDSTDIKKSVACHFKTVPRSSLNHQRITSVTAMSVKVR